jgi:hypothetical protein
MGGEANGTAKACHRSVRWGGGGFALGEPRSRSVVPAGWCDASESAHWMRGRVSARTGVLPSTGLPRTRPSVGQPLHPLKDPLKRPPVSEVFVLALGRAGGWGCGSSPSR